jgi:hypothetical protein
MEKRERGEGKKETLYNIIIPMYQVFFMRIERERMVKDIM